MDSYNKTVLQAALSEGREERKARLALILSGFAKERSISPKAARAQLIGWLTSSGMSQATAYRYSCGEMADLMGAMLVADFLQVDYIFLVMGLHRNMAISSEMEALFAACTRLSPAQIQLLRDVVAQFRVDGDTGLDDIDIG